MTDKQVIDGVDVSGCKYLYIVYPDNKFNNKSGCYAESERCVKMTRCKNCPNCYYKQLKRKEQECEKLKQTLTEIKEIAKNTIKNVSDRCIETTPMYSVHKQILQKISKCEVENGN